MFYKILYRAGAIALALALLIVAGILEAERKYGKQQREEEERMNKPARDVQKLNEINKNPALKPEQLAALHSQNVIKETYDLLGEVYVGIKPAEKKMISMEVYFLTYHKARDLKEQLIKFKKIVIDSLHSDELFKAQIMNFGEHERKGKKLSWENYYFETVTKDSAISYLEQMMATVAFAEIGMIRRRSAK